MKRIAVAVVIASFASFASAACSAAPRSGEDLLESVRTYNEGLRWERFTAAAARIPAKERDAFLDEREDLVKDLHITDYELVRVGGRHDDEATVEVKYTWYREAEGTVHETRANQSWERHGKVWLLVDERRRRGPEMPGLREPRKGAETADTADAPETASTP